MDFVAVERFGRPNSFGRENFGRGRAMFPGSTGTVGPFRYKISADRGFLSRFVRGANVFCRAIEIRPSTAYSFPARPYGRPDWNLLGQNSLLRVRGQCFGADCVFTPFSPSILS
ncbi:unnamed protein product [Microthlaspi erraticum]|uniref:Uncharacterized protein n=1 Tax=Microthlaspi erraticum TaxID=1685480 RepID=A0A6D2KS59_9BRAS|nr:unnamed protein product [Microthlaspi erraticum]